MTWAYPVVVEPESDLGVSFLRKPMFGKCSRENKSKKQHNTDVLLLGGGTELCIYKLPEAGSHT